MYSKIIVRSYADMLALNPPRDNYFISIVEGCANQLVSEKNGAHFPNQRKEIIQALRELFQEGLIYPEITDYGKYEQCWSLKKVE